MIFLQSDDGFTSGVMIVVAKICAQRHAGGLSSFVVYLIVGFF